jgi:hypothetical protein
VGRHLAFVLAAALVGSMCVACGGKKVSANWDAGSVTVTHQAVALLAKSFPGQCKDFGLYPRVSYVQNQNKIHGPVPGAVGSCTVIGENVEISGFASTKERDDFVHQRAQLLCARAAKAKSDFPGVRWVESGTWSMQPDTEGGARTIATRTHSKFVTTSCPGRGQINWSNTDVAHVNQLASTLTKAGLGCADFKLDDRDLLSHNAHYATAGLPGAYGECTVGPDAGVHIGSFDDTKTTLGQFANNEQQYACSSSKTSKLVIGSDWIVVLPKGQRVADVARALHGKPYGGSCPSTP